MNVVPAKAGTHTALQRALMRRMNSRRHGNDAVLLLESEHFPRATVLAILAEEEFAKAFIILTCSGSRTWNSEIHDGLRDHAPKQAITETIRKLLS